MTPAEKFRRVQEAAIPLGLWSDDDIQDSLEKDIFPFTPHTHATI